MPVKAHMHAVLSYVCVFSNRHIKQVVGDILLSKYFEILGCNYYGYNNSKKRGSLFILKNDSELNRNGIAIAYVL
ncbi:hypothetical protein ABD86_25920 [Paenibacillus alvei]|nr:hypothetical protein [Paenibacillus alvei]MBG9747208.1 hypothetical protein [Paenibacillus alvei]